MIQLKQINKITMWKEEIGEKHENERWATELLWEVNNGDVVTLSRAQHCKFDWKC